MEQQLLETYHLKTLSPQNWKQDTFQPDDLTDLSNADDVDPSQNHSFLLEMVNKDTNNLSLKDPIDPLNPSKKVIDVLSENGLANGEDISKFSIESKQFNSKQFLKIVHKEDTFNQLSESLNILDKSITEKNKELKSLVEREYLRFVRSKTSLDDVLIQFQRKGFNDEDAGLKSLKTAVNDANKEYSVLLKPVIANKHKELQLKQSIEFIEKKKFFFVLPKSLKNYILVNDYDNFIHDYRHAKQLKEADSNNKVVNRIWESVESIVDSYKKELWTQLNREENNDDFLKIIRKLIELETMDNPILEWIDFRSKKYISKFSETFNRYHEKILNVQLNILSTIDQPDYNSLKQVFVGNFQLVDSTIIVEMWLMIGKLFDSLNELVLDFIKFWNHVENLINGSYHSRLVSAYIDENSPFINFEKYEVDDIKAKGEQFIVQLVRKLIKFFSATQNSLKNLQSNPTLSSDGLVEDFGFLPPLTNSLSTLRYLPNISTKCLELANGLGQLKITDKTITELRELSSFLTERIVGAVCASWLNDCHNFYRLEKWSRLDSGETEIPTLMYDYETYIIEKLGNLLLAKLPEAKVVQIVRYTSKKILTGVQIQFLRSFDALLESVIKKIIEENHNTELTKATKNYHKLLTLFNIKKLTKTVVPAVIERFDSVFGTKLQSENLEIFSILEKMESTIFDSYMNDQRKTISKIVTGGVSSIDWSGNDPYVRKVSPYIYQISNVLIEVHTGVLSVSSDLISKVFENLLDHTSLALLKSFREINIFSTEGSQQLVLDLEFFKSLIGKSATDLTLKNLSLVYKNCQIDAKVTFGSIKETLDEALHGSSIERDVFNS